MAADIAQVIGACTPHRYGFGVGIFLNIYFVECAVAVILNPEHHTAHKLIVFYQFHKTHNMDLFTTADHFITSIIVNVFNKVR